jgi:threonine synthase
LYATKLTCASCGKEYGMGEHVYKCTACDGLLEVDYAYYEVAEKLSKQVLASRALRTMWRYGELLPVHYYPDLTLGEGMTALTRSRRLEKDYGLGQMFFKQEFTCPSGSFKDRGSSVLVARARELGFNEVVIDSSGNAAASLATYSARSGMACLVFVPSYVSTGKLIQCLTAGARVIKVRGTRQQTYEVANKVREKLRQLYCGFQTNAFTSEGMKTIAYEICEQFEWDPPDWVVFPVGTGSGISGCYRGFADFKRLGFIDQVPSLACIQPEGCNPISKAFEMHETSTRPLSNPTSIAEGLLIANPSRGERVLSILRETRGAAETVTDAEIEEASLSLMRREGLFVEPSAATSLAGLLKLTRADKIGRDERVVCILTGSGLKTPSFYQKVLTEPISINPDSQVEDFVGALN